jgi:quercetin dioxygenase-like cupin family protein
MEIHRMKSNVLLACLVGLAVIVGHVSSASGEKDVVPQQELEKAQGLGAEGPTETVGIESSVVLGTMLLSGEFDGLDGHVLRAREVVVLPGGQVAVHQHESRPAVAYVLEGQLVEHRNDEEGPITRAVGAVAFEKTGVIHWWKNESTEKARVLVVDIVPEATK